MKEYYGVNDIKQVIGCSQSMAYNIIRELKTRYEKEHPNSISIQGRIPIWYFNETQGLNYDNKKGLTESNQ